MSRIPWDEDLTPRNFAGFVTGAQTRPPRSAVPVNRDVPEGVEDIATRVTGEVIFTIQSRVNDSPLRRALMVVMSAEEYSNQEFEDMVTAILILINYRIENEQTAVSAIIDEEVNFGCKSFAAMMLEHPDLGREVQEFVDDDVYRNAREAMRQFDNDLRKARDRDKRGRGRDDRDDRDRDRRGGRGRDDPPRNGSRRGGRGHDDRDDEQRDERPFDRYGAGRGQPRSERRQEEPQRPSGARASVPRGRGAPPAPAPIQQLPAPTPAPVDLKESAMSNAFRELASKIKDGRPGHMVLTAQQSSYQDFIAPGTMPIVYDHVRSASFFATSDKTKPWINVIVPKDPAVKYEDHANEHLLRPRDAGFRASRRASYQPTAAQLVEASRSKKIDELLQEFQQASSVADGKDINFTIDTVVELANPIGDIAPVNPRAAMLAEVSGEIDHMNLDINKVPIGATIVSVTPWQVGETLANALAGCAGVETIADLISMLAAVRKVMPAYFWEWLNGQFTELFNESLVTMLGYPVVGDDNCLAIVSFYDNGAEAVNIVLDERGPRLAESFEYCFLKMIQATLLHVNNVDLLVSNNIAGIVDNGMYFITVSDYVLLPLSAADLALACAGKVGVLTSESLPELYALVKARMAAKHKQARRLTFETNEGLFFHVWPDALNKERFILSGVKTFSPS